MFNFPFAIKPICFQPRVVVNIYWGEGLLIAEVIKAQPLRSQRDVLYRIVLLHISITQLVD